MMSDENKVAVVTGAARGIGRATAISLARRGFAIALADRLIDEMNDAAEEVRGVRDGTSALPRERQPAAGRPHELWSMDFVSNALFDRRRLRALNVVDVVTREALAIEIDQGIKGEQVDPR